MSRIESLREMIKTMGSMTQPTRHHPIVIANPTPGPNANNAVRGILGEPLLVVGADGRYVRNEKGHLEIDQMGLYQQARMRNPRPSNYALDDVKFTDYIKALSDIPVSETPFRRMRLRPRRQSSYEMAIWGGFQWGGRTPAGATEHALRQAIRATFPKVLPRRHWPRRTLDFRGKIMSTGNLCREYFGYWTDAYYGLTKQQRKLQEIINARFDADSVRLSAQLASSYPQLPIDGRFAPSTSTLKGFYIPKQSGVYHSTGHWD